MTKKILSILACLLLLALSAQAALAFDTTWYPSSMPPVGTDARSFGMGGACLAVADPWLNPVNPALLTSLQNQGIFAGRFVNPPVDPVLGLGDQTYSYLAYLHPDEGNGAYSLMFYSNEYMNLYPLSATVNHYSTRYICIQYSYAYPVSDYISLGFSLRQVNTSDIVTWGVYAGEVNSHLLTADVGAAFHLGKTITAAVLITDVLAPEFYFSQDLDGDTFPDSIFYELEPRILFGGAFRLGNFLLIAVDVDYNIDTEPELKEMTRYGVELKPLPFLALRYGYYHGQRTMGFGFKLGKPDKVQICLDFAQYWSELEKVSDIQCIQMTVYF